MGEVLNTKKGTGGGGGGGSFLKVDGTAPSTGEQDFQAGIKSNTIAESTAAAGVTIDGVLLKDNQVITTALVSTGELSLDGPDLLILSSVTAISFSTAQIRIGGDEVAANSAPVIIDTAFFAGGGTITVSKGFVLAIEP